MEKKLSHYWERIQRSLFPTFAQEVGVPTPAHLKIMVVLDWLDLDRLCAQPGISVSPGRPPIHRAAVAAAFVAKSVLNLPSTKALIDRLKVDKVLVRICGFDPWKKLPCEATFSNVFAEFSESELPSRIHESLIKITYGELLDNKIVGHISRDSTDIAARGRVEKVPKALKGKRKKRLKGKSRRLARQVTMDLPAMLDDLPKQLDTATKRGHSWKGYKLHWDVSDAGVPISALVTSASLHDSQAAIPLEEMTFLRVKSLYSLMDSAYDAKEIREHVAKKGKVAIIEPHNRPNQKITLDPAERARFGERSTVERANSDLKDNLGARHVRVRGHSKVTAHLMFGVMSLAVLQIVRHFT